MTDQHDTTQQGEGTEPIQGEVLEFGPSAEALHERVAALETEAASARDQWMRTAAEFQNYKKRVERDRQELIKNANSGLLLKVLPALDDLDRAVGNIPPEVAVTPWWGGTRLVQHKLVAILESEGVSEISAVGQPFDPNLHEAVLYEDAGPDKGGMVVEVLQKGYMRNDKVLRPAMVKVGKE